MKNMPNQSKSVYAIIQELAATRSSNDKKAILQREVANEDLKTFFRLALSNQIRFYQKKPISSTNKVVGIELADAMNRLENNIANRILTGNSAILYIADLFNWVSDEDEVVLKLILQKKSGCDLGSALVNKIWPKLIPEFPVMLCEKYTKKTEDYLKSFEGKDAFNVSLKEDGGRVLITVDSDGEVSMLSRNGSELNVYGLFDKYFSPCKDQVFDGELIIKNKDGTPNRKLSNGIYTKLVRNTATKDEVNQFAIILWDVIPLDEYLNEVGTKPYSYRLNELKIYESSLWNNGPVKVVENKNVSTLEECFEFYDQMRQRQQEGSIIKVNSAVWTNARSKNSVKQKAEESGDFLCTGVELGQGKYSGMIGNLICETSDGKVKFNVGTGLKDSDRDPNIEYVGKIVECKFNELISSKNKTTFSLFLPVFSQIRHDKNVANSMSEL